MCWCIVYAGSQGINETAAFHIVASEAMDAFMASMSRRRVGSVWYSASVCLLVYSALAAAGLF
jgi:hypothetical protein